MATRRRTMPSGAMPARLPATLQPQLATLAAKPLPGDWLYEIKFDGYRMLARIGGAGDVRLFTRNGNDWTQRFPALVRHLAAAKLPAGWYDGEMVLLDDQGKPTFHGLQNAIESQRNDDIVYYLFDAPYMDGLDLTRVPVEERRGILQARLNVSNHVRFSAEVEGDIHSLVASACSIGLEGIIGKRRGSPYVMRRSEDWIKLKCVQRQEFVIGGFTLPEGSRVGLGALLVGYFDQAGVLQYAGKVGTGFTGDTLTNLRRRLNGIRQPARPFSGSTGHDRHAHWVQPDLVCEVSYGEWPAGQHLRHASFKGLRSDKPAVQVDLEQPVLRKAAEPRRALRSSTRVNVEDSGTNGASKKSRPSTKP